jgi:glycosyltransferase involved in cell wall biosynthesis
MSATNGSAAAVRLLEVRSTYRGGGGPDKTILLSAECHDPKRVQAVVAYVRDARDTEFSIGARARGRGFPYHELVESGKIDVRVIRRLRRLVVEHGINIIHGHDYKSDLLAFLTALTFGRSRPALVSTAHAWVILGPRGALYRRLDVALMRRFDHLIAVSHATRDEMLAVGLDPGKITVIHNAIDTEAWSPVTVSRDLRGKLGLADHFPVIGYVGRITPEKDLVTWLQAAALVSRACPRAGFVLFGEGRDGQTQQDLDALVTSLGIQDRVVFGGYRADPAPAYAACDLFLMSSLREGLPNSVLEAMALGLPVVSVDVAGVKELVENGSTGFILAQRDSEGLARALIRLATDHDLRRRMGRAGRARVEREFAFSRRLTRVEALYERVIEARLLRQGARATEDRTPCAG